MLLRFPTEVLRYIIEQLEDKHDLKSLCEVSKYLYSHAAEALYKKHIVTIKLNRDTNQNSLGLRAGLPLFAVSQRQSNPLQYIQALLVTSKFVHNITDRCPHNIVNLSHSSEEAEENHVEIEEIDEVSERDGEVSEQDDEDSEQDDEVSEQDDEVSEQDDEDASGSDGDSYYTARKLLPLLEPLVDGRLRNFSWDVGTCIPRRILGTKGYLPRHQKMLEHLSLFTDGRCARNIDGSSALFLNNFRHIKRVLWTGLVSVSDFQSLALAVHANADHLTGLYLDFETMQYDLDWVGGLGFRYNLIADELLNLSVDDTLPRCPLLEQFSLCTFSLTSMASNLTSAINFDSLRLLKLRECQNWEVFLTNLTRSGKTINLKSLEIQAVPGGVIDETIIGNFLAIFSGLEVLYLSLPGPPPQSLPIWEATRHHISTLRQFVYHLTANDLPLASDTHYFEGEMSINPEVFTRLYDRPSENPLSQLNIECLGLACEPELLRLGQPVLLPFAGTRSLKIIHVRQSGPNIGYFDSWGKHVFKDSKELAEFTDYVEKLDGDLLVQEMNGKSRSWFVLHDWEDGSSSGEGEFDVTPLCLEFRELADWAFGPHGIASLSILAFGDFSCRDRFAADNFLLCRIDGPLEEDQLSYRQFNPRTEDNKPWKKLLNDHVAFFQACPADILMT